MIRLRTMCGVAAVLWLAACADPLSDFDRLSDVPLPEGSESASVAPGAADAAGAPPVLPGLLAGILAEGATDETAEVTPASVDAATVAAPAPAADETPGFFSRVFGGGGTPASAATPGLPAGAVEIAGAPPLPPGSTVPYGVIATVCGLDASALGQPVENASGYTVYDTNPSSTAPRTQYVTGFSDGCARQFTGSLALFGDIGTHELVRYSGAAGSGYTTTDNAYEQIKVAYCGVASGAPCGARIDALAQRTTFLTIYQTFGTANGWADVLLSDGRVVAADF